MKQGSPSNIGICFLGSGSKGNAAVIRVGKKYFLLDAGLSYRRISQALKDLQIATEFFEGIFLSHAHGDHIQGLPTLLKHLPLPVYCTPGTYNELNKIEGGPRSIIPLRPGTEMEVGGLRVWPFAVPHDAPDTIGFRFETEGKTLAVATDMGHVTPEALEHLTNADILCLESNYDEEMLLNCRYPGWLKTRIKGPLGHLSNTGTRGILSRQRRHLAHLMLVHLSQESNTHDLVRKNVQPLLALSTLKNARVTVAGQDAPTDWAQVPATDGTPLKDVPA